MAEPLQRPVEPAPLDLTVLQAEKAANAADAHPRHTFVPFDPAIKRSAITVEVGGAEMQVVTDTPPVVGALAQAPPPDGQIPSLALTEAVTSLASGGTRVLAVAAGTGGSSSPASAPRVIRSVRTRRPSWPTSETLGAGR
jgi:magnesium-transporting ATPase (P-type)